MHSWFWKMKYLISKVWFGWNAIIGCCWPSCRRNIVIGENSKYWRECLAYSNLSICGLGRDRVMERVIKMPQRVPYWGGISFSAPGGMGMRRDHNILCSLSYLSTQRWGEGGNIGGTKWKSSWKWQHKLFWWSWQPSLIALWYPGCKYMRSSRPDNIWYFKGTTTNQGNNIE